MKIGQNTMFSGLINSNNVRSNFTLKNNPVREREIETSTDNPQPRSRSFGSLSPLLLYTNVNAYTVPAVELTHHEWLATLDPIIRNQLDSHGDAEFLSHLDAEGRRGIVESAKEAMVQAEYIENLRRRLGPNLSTLNVQFYPQRFFIAFFYGERANDDNRILVRFEDESELSFSVSRNFTSKHFNRFLTNNLPRLMDDFGLMNTRASVSQLRSIFEDFFMNFIKPRQGNPKL